MPSAEEDHDHDLPCYTRRRSDYHHRWIFWAVNVAPRQIQRSCRRVRQRETSATSESRQIGPKQHWWTPRPFQVARSSSIGISPLSTATATATAGTVALDRDVVDRPFVRACRSSSYGSSLYFAFCYAYALTYTRPTCSSSGRRKEEKEEERTDVDTN